MLSPGNMPKPWSVLLPALAPCHHRRDPLERGNRTQLMFCEHRYILMIVDEYVRKRATKGRQSPVDAECCVVAQVRLGSLRRISFI